MNKKKFTYKKSGVDIKSADNLLISFLQFHQKKKAKKSFPILADLVQYQTFQIT
jgi:retron-type reverse transcriptase